MWDHVGFPFQRRPCLEQDNVKPHVTTVRFKSKSVVLNGPTTLDLSSIRNVCHIIKCKVCQIWLGNHLKLASSESVVSRRAGATECCQLFWVAERTLIILLQLVFIQLPSHLIWSAAVITEVEMFSKTCSTISKVYVTVSSPHKVINRSQKTGVLSWGQRAILNESFRHVWHKTHHSPFPIIFCCMKSTIKFSV